jgi:hypothetical protein
VAVAVGVAVGGANCAQYLPPVFVAKGAAPPQTIISLPVQTAGATRAVGALVVLVGLQLSVPGSYLPPVPKSGVGLAVTVAVAVGVGDGCEVSNGAGYVPPVFK